MEEKRVIINFIPSQKEEVVLTMSLMQVYLRGISVVGGGLFAVLILSGEIIFNVTGFECIDWAIKYADWPRFLVRLLFHIFIITSMIGAIIAVISPLAPLGANVLRTALFGWGIFSSGLLLIWQQVIWDWNPAHPQPALKIYDIGLQGKQTDTLQPRLRFRIRMLITPWGGKFRASMQSLGLQLFMCIFALFLLYTCSVLWMGPFLSAIDQSIRENFAALTASRSAIPNSEFWAASCILLGQTIFTVGLIACMVGLAIKMLLDIYHRLRLASPMPTLRGLPHAAKMFLIILFGLSVPAGVFLALLPRWASHAILQSSALSYGVSFGWIFIFVEGFAAILFLADVFRAGITKK